jgi:hypothetical protein
VGQEPVLIQKKIVKWARKKGYTILIYKKGFIKLRISKGYSRAVVVLYILTLWIGAIVHRIMRMDHGKLVIYLHPYGPGTYLYLTGEGIDVIRAIADLKHDINAKIFKYSDLTY